MTDWIRVLVTGGRKYHDAAKVREVLMSYNISELCHGDADGADALAGEIAESMGIPVKTYPADWLGPCTNMCKPGHRRVRPGLATTSRRVQRNDYCPAAGTYRNHDMLEDFRPDLVIAFPGGRGTADMVKQSREARVDVDLVAP